MTTITLHDERTFASYPRDQHPNHRPIRAGVSLPPPETVQVKIVNGDVTLELLDCGYWGYLTMYIDPDEARRLGRRLIEVADQAEREQAQP